MIAPNDHTKFRILLVEDSKAFAEMLIESRLSNHPAYAFETVWVTSLRQAEEQMATGGDFDVILLDLGLPDSTTTQTLARLEDLAARWAEPIVVITGSHDVSALQKGATEFVYKTDMKDLIVKIVSAYTRHHATQKAKP